MTTTWMVTDETTRRHKCLDWNRPTWPNYLMEYDDDDDDDEGRG
jgi:hypothetical protein